MTYTDAKQIAQAADDRLSALLTARYGKRAGDMRYRPAETPEIAEAMRAFVDASDVCWRAWEAYR